MSFFFTVIISEILDTTDKFLLNHSYLFYEPLFIGHNVINSDVIVK